MKFYIYPCLLAIIDWFLSAISLLQPSLKSMRRRRSWMRSRAPLSLLFWAPHSGTRCCHMMATTSSWTTWTWRSSCLRMVFHQAPPSTMPVSTNHMPHPANHIFPRPHTHLRRLWWTSVTTPPPRYTVTACAAARREQVRATLTTSATQTQLHLRQRLKTSAT